VTHLIEVVEEALFDPTPEEVVEEEELRGRTLAAFRLYLPQLIARFLGSRYTNGTHTVLNCLQVTTSSLGGR